MEDKTMITELKAAVASERAELREKMRGLHARCQLLAAVKAAAHRISPELVAVARAERATMDTF